MSISDIVWPWGALRRERKTQASRVNEERERADRLSLKVIKLTDENLRFRRLLEHSHYRDPQTGRIGKQGEYPL